MPVLELVRHADAAQFLGAAGDFLSRREAEHNLLLGICGRLRTAPRLYGSDPYFATVSGDGAAVGAAIRTPPYNLILSEQVDLDAVDLLVADSARAFGDVPGVLGPKEASRRFADGWCETRGVTARLAMEERIFRCRKAVPQGAVRGRLRKATAAERDLLVAWVTAFMAEALPNASPRPAEEAVDDYLDRTGDLGVYLWDDDGPVSLAGCGNPTPTGVRIGPVYTPPELRGRGYASALTASLTQLLLNGDRKFCFLFTDLANPTSNRIYQRIGYEPVADVDEYRFEAGRTRATGLRD